MTEKTTEEETKQPKQQEKEQEPATPVYGIQTGTEVLLPPQKDWPGGFPRTCKQVAIVGFAPSSMRDAVHLFGNPDIEIWGLNQLYMAFPEILPGARPPDKRNVTRWFQIHHRHSYDQTINRDHSHHEWLAQRREVEFPIYMQNKEPDVPMSVEFPKDMIVEKFGNYFTNSISWEIALAIHEGFEKIYIFGVDMAQDSEYSFERPSVEYFIGIARGAGINVVVPEKSDILKTMWLYPFEDSAPFRAKIEARRIELRERLQSHSMQEQQHRDSRNQLMGALENMNYIAKTWENAQKELVTPGVQRGPATNN